MKVVVYVDFNCLYSYLASQRADLMNRAGVAVDWRAVEHDGTAGLRAHLPTHAGTAPVRDVRPVATGRAA